jgi:hypothetical protein
MYIEQIKKKLDKASLNYLVCDSYRDLENWQHASMDSSGNNSS